MNFKQAVVITNSLKNVLKSRRNQCSSASPELPGMRSGQTTFKDFNEIPGPKSLPIIGTLYSYLPFIGEFGFTALHKNASIRYKKYGKLVKETITPGVHLIHVYDPDDIETILRFSGKFPERRSHTGLERYRLNKKDSYNSGGIFPSNGEEWFKLRSLFQKPLSSPRSAARYNGSANTVVSAFIDRIKNVMADRDVKQGEDFLNELSRLNLQLVCIVAFDVILDTFSEKEMSADSISTNLIEKAAAINYACLKTDYMPEFVQTLNFPMYKKMCNDISYLEKIAVKYIAEKAATYSKDINDSDKEPSLLESYLSNPMIDMKDIVGMSADFLLAGIDTTSYATSFTLYHLSKNKHAQETLYQEAMELLPNPDDYVTSEILTKASYLKACVKESLRIHPISIGIGRNITQDIVLSGYFIPKGTIAVTQNQLACSLPEYFNEPARYVPERWLKNSVYYKPIHPFISIPFGHGSRMCMARRLAEQNMYITIMKLVRNFELTWVGEEMEIETRLINKPKHPVKIKLKSRNNQ